MKNTPMRMAIYHQGDIIRKALEAAIKLSIESSCGCEDCLELTADLKAAYEGSGPLVVGLAVLLGGLVDESIETGRPVEFSAIAGTPDEIAVRLAEQIVEEFALEDEITSTPDGPGYTFWQAVPGKA